MGCGAWQGFRLHPPSPPTHPTPFGLQDRTIFQAVAEHGTKWALIVKLVPGRTDNAIKNRWNSVTRKLIRMQKREHTQTAGGQRVDYTVMAPSDLARYLLSTGIDPRAPLAKRRLVASPKPYLAQSSVPSGSTVLFGTVTTLLQPHERGGRSGLIPQKAAAANYGASPETLRAALSLASAGVPQGAKRPRMSNFVPAASTRKGCSSPRSMEAAACLGSIASSPLVPMVPIAGPGPNEVAR